MEAATLFFLLRLAAGALLIAILLLLLYAQWREAQTPQEGASRLPAARLRFIGGPRQGESFTLQAVNLIGRAADNDLQLEEPTVSAYHARLSYQQNQWWLEDLGSRNGTWLNEIRIRQPVVVTFGDRLKFGTLEMLLEPDPAAGPVELVPSGQ